MGSLDPGPLCLLGHYDRRPVEVPRVEPNPMVERAFVIQFGAREAGKIPGTEHAGVVGMLWFELGLV